MNRKLQVQVKSRNVKGVTYYEGIVNIVGLQPTKITKRSDNTTLFEKRSALASAARSVVTTLGYESVVFSDTPVVAAN